MVALSVVVNTAGFCLQTALHVHMPLSSDLCLPPPRAPSRSLCALHPSGALLNVPIFKRSSLKAHGKKALPRISQLSVVLSLAFIIIYDSVFTYLLDFFTLQKQKLPKPC